MDSRPSEPREPHHFPRGKCGPILIFLFLLGAGLASAQEPDHLPGSVEELRQAVEEAFRNHDEEALRALVYWGDTDSYGRESYEATFKRVTAHLDSVVFIPADGTEFTEVTIPEGIVYKINLEVLGRLDISLNNRKVQTGFYAAEKDGAFVIPAWAPADTLLPPDQDPIANRTELEREVQKQLDELYALSDGWWKGEANPYNAIGRDILYEPLRDLGHPHPTLQARGLRFAMLVIEDALRYERLSAVPDSLGSDVSLKILKLRSREIRKTVAWNANYLREPSIPLARYYLDREPREELQSLGAYILAKIDGASADSMLLALTENPVANPSVSLTALAYAAEKKLPVSAPALRRFEQDDNPQTAYWARALNDSLGYPAMAPYDSVRAMQSDRVARLMSGVDSLMVFQIPPESPYVVAAQCKDLGRGSTRCSMYPGWIAGSDSIGPTLVVAGAYKTHIGWFLEGIEDENGWKPSVDTVGLAEIGKYDPKPFFHCALPVHYGVEEAVMANWLFNEGEFLPAARLLFPLLEEGMPPLFRSVEESVGELLGRFPQVLAGDRDYEAVLKMADKLVERYPRSEQAETARRLLTELPRRTEDFHELRLPTPKEWRELQREMNRDGEVRYLCKRLRLVNWYWQCRARNHFGHDREAREASPQYAEPNGISEFFGDRQLRKGETEVVNPYVELLDYEIRDIPTIAAFLLEDWFTLGVTGHYQRIVRTSELLSQILNAIAKEDICPKDWTGMSGEEKEKKVAAIVTWAETRMDQPAKN